MRHTNKRIMKAIGLAVLAIAVLTGCNFEINVFPGFATRSDITFELVWDNSNVDLDLYLTYPNPVQYSVDSGDVPQYERIQDAYDASTLEGNLGFFPEDATVNPDRRANVYADNTRSADGNAEFFAPRARTQIIRVWDIPFEYGSLVAGDFNTSPASPNALPGGRTYAWVGVMEVYVWGRTGNVSDAGSPIVNVYDNSNTKFASFPIDESTHIKGLSVARIPVFRTSDNRNYYQILLDKRLVNSTGQIRSVAPSGDYYILGVEGTDDE